MILVDPRAGSGPLLKPLLAAGIPAESAYLDYGDLAFEGKGNEGVVVQVGVEFKTLHDLVDSLRSGRLTGRRKDGSPGQLQGMMESYDYAWLLMEGQWRENAAGMITEYKGPHRGWTAVPGGMNVYELEARVLGLEMCGGLRVRHTNRRADTVRVLGSLYRWWTDRALDQHSSHLAPHRPTGVIALSLFRQAVMAWPGIGRKASMAVELHFGGSIRAAVQAPAREWAEIETVDDAGKSRRLGHVAADRLRQFFEGGQCVQQQSKRR